METKVQLKPETLHFLEALQELLQVEESIYSGLTETYGEDRMWYKSPVYTFLESAKREVKILLGDSLELSFSGALDKVEETAEKEGVC